MEQAYTEVVYRYFCKGLTLLIYKTQLRKFGVYGFFKKL